MNEDTLTARRARREIARSNVEEEAQQSRLRDQLLLEQMPQDPAIRSAFDRAASGVGITSIVVKGFRPMYQRPYPYDFNWFYIEGYAERIPVPTICRLADVDPSLVNDAFFYFRNIERWPCESTPELDEEIVEARRQLITNLFPFPELEWLRESGSDGGSYVLATVQRKEPFLTTAEILQQCEAGKVADKAYRRRVGQDIRRRRKNRS